MKVQMVLTHTIVGFQHALLATATTMVGLSILAAELTFGVLQKTDRIMQLI